MRTLLSAGLGALSLATALLSAPTPARACGGFFCNAAQPVNQAAERIIFARGDDGEVTALIQIQYSGPSENFAWMLPVQGVPEIGVSSNSAFDRLQAATNPLYQLNTTVEGTCSDDSFFRGGGPVASPGGAADAGAFEDGMRPPVSVLDAGTVGPYDFVIINVDPSLEDLAAEAIAWLRENHYDVDEFGADMLEIYLEQGMNLLAFRLTKGADAGSIRPVRLSFGTGLPSIPIRPTAVAATDDMGVMVWVLGEHRAIPANYRDLELNEALINWINPNANYNDVVTQAANEAGGQGFVTEMAGPAAPLADAIWPSWQADDFDELRRGDWTDREGEFVNRLASFADLDGMGELLRRHLTVPEEYAAEGVTEEQFFSCVWCYVRWDIEDIEGLEPAAFLDEMAEDVIAPMAETAALFEAIPYATRFYTTMSAHEMTMDPIFDFNADLDDVSNVHTADRIIECAPSVSRAEAPYRVVLPSGEVVRGVGNTWPFTVGDEDMPAVRRVRRVGTEGEGAVIDDNVEQIQASLSRHNATVPRPRARIGGGGGCSSTNAGGTGLGLVSLLGLALFARRRRSR